MGKGCALCKPACFLARKEAGHKTGKQCMWPTTCDFCLLVAAPPPPLNTEFHSVATRSPNVIVQLSLNIISFFFTAVVVSKNAVNIGFRRK